MTPEILADLQQSGLEPGDIRAREIDDAERKACGLGANIDGYVIPYYSLSGQITSFYRVKLFDHTIKYKQVKDTLNHVYFPPSFSMMYSERKMKKGANKDLFFIEGEKKAAALCKHGFLACAFGGVDSWKNRRLLLPDDTEFTKSAQNKKIVAKLPSGEAVNVVDAGFAEGFPDIVARAARDNFHVYVVYDTDDNMIKFDVQRAAASLGYALRGLRVDMTHIHQLILPSLGELKMGADDFLMHEDGGPEEFQILVDRARGGRTFPRHPNPAKFVDRVLSSARGGSREDLKNLSIALVAELDAKGRRMSADDGALYYFDDERNELMKATGVLEGENSAVAGPFAGELYHSFGVSPTADPRLMRWVQTTFSQEKPITHVTPQRVLARPKDGEDAVRFQISDSQYIKITAEAVTLHDNGQDGYLFESGRVKSIDVEKFVKEIRKQREMDLSMWWLKVMQESRMKNKEANALLISLLYYVAPFLYRWRGMQLPIEINVGEAGSGKSTMQEMRLLIQTGTPDLKNAPGDLKDWNAAISNSGGLHVTDNVELDNKEMRTKLSNELCRLITEPQPHIEMRKLYTNNEQAKVKVDNVFVFTAIRQPFLAGDVLQRSVVVEYDKGSDKNLSYDAGWKERKIEERGGREAWLAHHCIVLQKFFQAVQEHWDPAYMAKYRLINLEQTLRILAKQVFGIEDEWIQTKLAGDVTKHVAAADRAIEGLTDYARLAYKQPGGTLFTAKSIANWARNHEDYDDCIILINARKLGIYLSSNKNTIATIAGIVDGPTRNNLRHYKIDAATVEARLADN